MNWMFKATVFAAGVLVTSASMAQGYNSAIDQLCEMYQRLYGSYGQEVQCRNAVARSDLGEILSTQAGFGCENCENENPVRFQRTKVFGEDQRDSDDGILTVEEDEMYSGVGRIECTDEEGNRREAGTGFIAGRLDTIVSVAHVFRGFRPGQCVFRRYNREGYLIAGAEYKIKVVKSRWEDDGVESVNNDFAMARLDRIVKDAWGYAIWINQSEPRNDLELIAFHHDVKRGRTTARRKSSGSIYPKRGTEDDRHENIAVVDMDANGMASGGPVFIKGTKTVIGMMRGGRHSAQLGNVFDPRRNYNQVIIFDKRFLDELKVFVSTEI